METTLCLIRQAHLAWSGPAFVARGLQRKPVLRGWASLAGLLGLLVCWPAAATTLLVWPNWRQPAANEPEGIEAALL